MKFSARFSVHFAAVLLLTACTAGGSTLFAEDNPLGKEIQTVSFSYGITKTIWSSDQKLIAVQARGLHIYDVAKDRIISEKTGLANAFDPTGRFLIGVNFPPATEGFSIKQIDQDRSNIVYTLIPVEADQNIQYVRDDRINDPAYKNPQYHGVNGVAGIAVSTDGSAIAVSMGAFGAVAFYDTKTWTLTRQLGPWTSVAHPNSSSFTKMWLDIQRGMLIGYDGIEVDTWDINTNKRIAEFQPYAPSVAGPIAYNSSTGALVTGTETMPKSDAFLEQVRRTSNGKLHFLTSPDDAHIIAWDPRTGNKLITYDEGPGNEVLDLAVSSDGKYIAAVKGGGLVEANLILWDAVTGRMITYKNYGKGRWVQGLSFSPDGKRLAYGLDTTMHIIEINPSVSPQPGD